MNPLEPYLPYIRYVLIAILPALLVYVAEQRNITSLKAQLVETQQQVIAPPPPPVHLFTSKDAETLSKLEADSNQFTKTIDLYRPDTSKISELICMQGMRNSASSYLTSMITQARQPMNMAINAKNQDDVVLANRQLQAAIDNTYKYVPSVLQNTSQITTSCNGSQTVLNINNIITRFVNTQLLPTFAEFKTRLAKAKY